MGIGEGAEWYVFLRIRLIGMVYADIFEHVAMGQTPTQGEIHDMIAMVDEDNSGEIGAFHLAAALGRITNGDLS